MEELGVTSVHLELNHNTPTTQETPQNPWHLEQYLAHSGYLLGTFYVSGPVLGSRLALMDTQAECLPRQHL